MNRYKRSQEYLERAKKVIPGAAQTLSKMPARFPQGAFPVALDWAQDARVYDIDGNEYVDWIGALGAVPLGYTYTIGAKVDEVLYGCGAGAMSLPHKIELALAERLCEKIPCAEMVRFVNSGSEATEAAIRTARIATGRDKILTIKTGYHSWHSWFQAVKDWHPGVPKSHEWLITGINYNDKTMLHDLLHTGVYAALIMEPTLFEPPDPDYLELARDCCSDRGTVLIFDEMVTGYRWALAGGQEYFKVTPDLATFGKGMANGLPIGMLCGKREYMQHAELISGTFGGNAASLAAANAVLDVYESEPVIKTMWIRGAELQEYFNSAAALCNANAVCDGYAVKPRFKFEYGEKSGMAMSLFLQEAAASGTLFHPGGMNVCYALTDEDMHRTFIAIERGLAIVADSALHDDWSTLKGDIIKPVVTVRQ